MILIDFNQIFIGNLMQHIKYGGEEIEESLVRHMIFNSILSYKKKFSKKFGNVIICCDDRHYWRKEIFPYYKANRKKYRQTSGLDWKTIFELMNIIKTEIIEYLPYKVISVEGAEADDIIGTVVNKLTMKKNNGINIIAGTKGSTIQEPTIIVSSDKDFQQLQKNKNVKQYSPLTDKFLSPKNPAEFLKEHILYGDTGDGIPNFLSVDDTFVDDNKRQKPISKKKLAVWITQDPSEFCDEVQLKNYRRNEQLIDLDKIPNDLTNKIIKSFEEATVGNRYNLMNFFIKKRMKNLVARVDEF